MYNECKFCKRQVEKYRKNTESMLRIDLQETLNVVMNLLSPVVEAIEDKKEFYDVWKKDDLTWHSN